MKIKIFLLLLFFSLFLPIKNAQAENLRSDSYYIQFGNFNMTSGKKSGETYTVTDTVGGMAIGPYGQYGSSQYFIGSGFQYIYQIDRFTFSISKLSIDLGELFYGSFGTDSHSITITTNGASGYKIYAFESTPLRFKEEPNAEIVDTTCDNNDCDESQAAVWTDPSKDGFGFNLTGSSDIASDFSNATYFRQFANNEASEAMQEIMGSNNVALNQSATVTYQAAPSGDQSAGTYTTNIVFVAVPGY